MSDCSILVKTIFDLAEGSGTDESSWAHLKAFHLMTSAEQI